MPRARNIKPSFFTNEQLAECSMEARLLFIGLWTLADREGRLEDRPKKIRVEVFPYDLCDCEPLLAQLHAQKFIVRYEIDGSRYIAIPNFTKHQSPHKQEKPSTIPAPDSNGTKPESVEKLLDSVEPAPVVVQKLPDAVTLNDECGMMKDECGKRNEDSLNASVADKSAERDSELLEWIAFWKSLKARGLVVSGVSDIPGKGLYKAWQRVQKSPELKRLLADKPAIEAAILRNSFAQTGSWFCLEKLLGGTNKDGTYIVQRLIDDGYTSASGSPKRTVNVGPGVNYAQTAAGLF